MAATFKETQRFSKAIFLLIVPILWLPIFGLYKQIYLGEPFGDNPLSNQGLILFSVLILGVLLLFWFMKLETDINQDRINFRLVPFVKRTYLWQDIKSVEVLKYGFVGGWGIRLKTKYGTVYNMSGDRGLAIELKDGKKLLLGTQQAKELESVISDIGNL